MAYATGNPKTKAELKRLVNDGGFVQAYNPATGRVVPDGIEYIEGPHYPKPHRWYAQVEVRYGIIVKVK